MAKLRRNHSPRGGAAAASTLVRVALFALIIFGIVWAFHKYLAGPQVESNSGGYAGEAYYLPQGSAGPVITHGGFVLAYHEDWEQAEWVAYILTRDHLQRKWTERRDNFREDPLVRSGSATDGDYRGSGYDRGHLAPFADFAWNAELADKTFYLSNVSPQEPGFNRGIWRELEELTRDWAKRERQLYVVSGPVTTEDPQFYIGRDNRVAVPRTYFKVLLDLEQPEQKGIGFLLPNALSDRPLTDYAVPIDEVERRTGLDFFADLLPTDLEERLEAAVDPGAWRFNNEKYHRRREQWNKLN